MDVCMTESVKKETTTKNKTLRNKNFVFALEEDDLTRFDVRVMEKYPAYPEFFPLILIGDFIKKHNITDVLYRHFFYLCNLVNDYGVKTVKGFKVRKGRKRVKKGRFAHVRFYSEHYLQEVYEVIKKANLVEEQEHDTKEAC